MSKTVGIILYHDTMIYFFANGESDGNIPSRYYPLVIPPSTNKNCLVVFEDIVLVLIEILKHILITPTLNNNDADTSV